MVVKLVAAKDNPVMVQPVGSVNLSGSGEDTVLVFSGLLRVALEVVLVVVLVEVVMVLAIVILGFVMLVLSVM